MELVLRLLLVFKVLHTYASDWNCDVVATKRDYILIRSLIDLSANDGTVIL